MILSRHRKIVLLPIYLKMWNSDRGFGFIKCDDGGLRLRPIVPGSISWGPSDH